jgi:molybdopterin-containing oxidoreductase family iron-sulfur binding subunit
MAISRRQLLQLFGAAGVSISVNDWLFSRLEAYASDRLGYRDVRGPGTINFSRSVCRDCSNHCSLAVRKVDALPVGLRGTPWHPASRGALCVAGQSQMQALFDPDRLEKPLLRDDAGAPGRVAEWDEAIGALAGRLGELVSSGDGGRLAVVDGRTPSLATRLLESWVGSIPGARYIPLRIEHALDQLLRSFLGGAQGGRPRFDLAHTGTLLLVGSELLEVDGSPVVQMRAHGERREDPRLDHAPTIYLGPRQGPTAIQGDYWIPCQPGQERDILLSFAEALSRKHPRRDSIPAVTLPGPGVLRRPHGFTDARSALALNLWTGGFARTGGLSWGRDPLSDVAGRLGFAPPAEPDPGALSQILQPLFEIKRSPVDVLLCVEANLVHELPGKDQVARALSHVPFVASFSSHEDETSRIAHVTLPTPLDLESWDLPAAAWGAPEASLQVQRPAVVPVVEARAVEDVILGLASDGAAGSGFSPPAEDLEGTVEAALRVIVDAGHGELVGSDGREPLASPGASAALQSLLSGESVWVPGPAPGPTAAKPEAPAALASRPRLDLAPEQLWLVPFDAPAIQRGRILNRPMMMEISGMLHGTAWESWVEIHPQDARDRKIGSGDRLKVRGPRAEITSRAVVTRAVTPGVVAIPVGFGHEALGSIARGRGANPLELPFAVLDSETGAPAWGPVPVFVVKA